MLKNLFEFMYSRGDMMVVFLREDYCHIANKFQKFINKKPGTWKRYDQKKDVSFICDDNNDCITFTFTSTNNVCLWSDKEGIAQGKLPCSQYIIIDGEHDHL